MKRWVVIVLFIVLLAGMTAAAVYWQNWQNNQATVGLDVNFKLIALGISTVAITTAAGMFIWILLKRSK